MPRVSGGWQPLFPRVVRVARELQLHSARVLRFPARGDWDMPNYVTKLLRSIDGAQLEHLSRPVAVLDHRTHRRTLALCTGRCVLTNDPG